MGECGSYHKCVFGHLTSFGCGYSSWRHLVQRVAFTRERGACKKPFIWPCYPRSSKTARGGTNRRTRGPDDNPSPAVPREYSRRIRLACRVQTALPRSPCADPELANRELFNRGFARFAAQCSQYRSFISDSRVPTRTYSSISLHGIRYFTIVRKSFLSLFDHETLFVCPYQKFKPC
jgi:hypothetical protein